MKGPSCYKSLWLFALTCEQNLNNDRFRVMEWPNICDVYYEDIWGVKKKHDRKKVQLEIRKLDGPIHRFCKRKTEKVGVNIGTPYQKN